LNLKHSIARRALVGALLVALCPTVAFAKGSPPKPVDPPEQVAQLRERFESMTAGQGKSAGYVAEPPVCVSAPGIGGMGIHTINRELYGAQFPRGEMDPQNPSVLLLDANQERVIGLEWEAKDVGQGQMEMFGVPIRLQQGHPGVPEPHFMLHIYFKPNGKVLMLGADPAFDPDVKCPAGMPDAGAGGMAGRDGECPGWLATATVLLLGSASLLYFGTAAGMDSPPPLNYHGAGPQSR
jgi:hypothetical protein